MKQITRRSAVLPLLLICAAAVWGAGSIVRAPAPAGEAAMLQGACRWLWAQQSADGGWHSRTYGLLRSGQALTPVILHALIDAEGAHCPAPREGVRQGLGFIRRHLNDEGALGYHDPDVLEYPNYATAYALRVLVRHGAPADAALISRMTRYLAGQQFDERRGIGPAHPAYGGWGFGEQRLSAGRVGHVDLSHTRRVLQALREAGYDGADTYARATAYLHLHQRHPDDARLETGAGFDGGFFSSAASEGVNKSAPWGGAPITGGPVPFRVYHSYATATADGLLALRAVGVEPGDARLVAAQRWLDAHTGWAAPEAMPPGFVDWPGALALYHLAARAEAHAPGGDRRAAMLAQLAAYRQDEGQFLNAAGTINKEDDPLLATTLAVQTLVSLQPPPAGLRAGTAR